MKKLISWVEIPATDFSRATKFYASILNIEFKIMEGENEKMACFPSGEGAISFAPNFKPSENGVLVSLNVEDSLDQTLQNIEKLGGRTVIPKTKIQADGMDYFATFIDCEGNKLGLYGK